MSDKRTIAADVKLGDRVKIFDFVNLYGCEIGDNTKIGTFVEVQKNAKIGRDCKISSHTFICEGVTIEDEVFSGHGVMFINDRYPRATTDGHLQGPDDWKVVPTRVGRGASIGSGAVIMCGVCIGPNAVGGAGAGLIRSSRRDKLQTTSLGDFTARCHGKKASRSPHGGNSVGLCCADAARPDVSRRNDIGVHIDAAVAGGGSNGDAGGGCVGKPGRRIEIRTAGGNDAD